jgi:photosystem II stability/assembly factor-like uncharacterized protein
MKKLFTINNLTSGFFYLSILIFLIGFNFTDSPPPSGWYQQFMPNIGGKQIVDITFLDSLTGIAVANQYPSDSNYVLKTTNGGDNWQIIFRQYYPMQHIQFLNLNTGYACAGYLYKTIDGGYSWNLINTSGISAGNMYVWNQDTIWLTDENSLVGGVFLTTNGGINWTPQLTIGNLNPDHIYMYNARIGFISRVNSGAPYIRRTTNGGQNWVVIVDNGSFSDMYFIDSLTGWRAGGLMYKTTDGGLNWDAETLPHGGNLITYTISRFSNANKDTIWGIGNSLGFPNNQYRGVIYRTTNSGMNWGFQLPDTSINIPIYFHIKFADNMKGWAYSGIYGGVHTLTGGDTVIYYGIQEKSSEIPKNFVLKQNYPNPFNPRTVIPYSLKSAGYVRIIAYDILGRAVQRLVDQKQSAGEYEVDFMGKFTATGVYFYRMTVDGNVIGTKKMLLLK